jgi:hypothetical protein
MICQWIRALNPIACMTPISTTILWDSKSPSISINNHLVPIEDYEIHAHKSLEALTQKQLCNQENIQAKCVNKTTQSMQEVEHCK